MSTRAADVREVGHKHGRDIDTVLPALRRFQPVNPLMGQWDTCCDGPQQVNPTAAPSWPWSKAWWPAFR